MSTDEELGRLEVGIVGGGRVAVAFASALAEEYANCDVLLWARSPRSVEWSPAARPVEVTDDLARVAARSTLLVAVSDDAIELVSSLLAALVEPHGEPVVVLHSSGVTTGAASMGPLAAAAGVTRGSLHPLVAVPRAAEPRLLAGVPHVVEAESEAGLRRAEDVVRRLGGELVRLPDASEETKARYHALATMVATGVVALVDRATAELVHDAADRASFRAAFARLAASAVANVSRGEGADVLTGAIARGDTSTLERHAQVLDGGAAEELYAAVRQGAEEMLRDAEEGRS